MILIDANALVVLIIGLMDLHLLGKHKRVSIYETQDWEELVLTIGDIGNLTVLPNVWTETDNLLNNFTGNYKYRYVETIIATQQQTTEKFIPTTEAVQNPHFYDLGITDALLLNHARHCRLLITSDSKLADYATAYGIPVYDVVKNRNARL